MQWNGESYIREVERSVAQTLQAIGYAGVSEIRESVSVSGRTITTRTINKGKRKGQTQKVLGRYGSNPSKPGEPPHKQRGDLRRSIAQQHDPEKLVTRIGTNLPYGKYLEVGTSKMAPRPYLRPWLANNRDRIVKMVQDAANRTKAQS